MTNIFSDSFINQIADRVADRVADQVIKKISEPTQTNPVLTTSQACELLRCTAATLPKRYPKAKIGQNAWNRMKLMDYLK